MQSRFAREMPDCLKASGGLKDSTIAEAVIKKLKGAIDSVGEGE